jgi:NAD(P)-dependent dehydrogenase (short-subunit alcohol dehydrogenase family)
MSPIILVTGANRGIGFAIVQATALRVPQATYLLACRSQDAGEKSIEDLKNLGVTAKLDVIILDVTDDASIINAKNQVEKKYGLLDSQCSYFHPNYTCLTSGSTGKQCWHCSSSEEYRAQ